ncbi:hypothetical protein [Arenibaculum pallidiluteum]|uniref:hypothetical protein n=1 Tax=Arenibaculum pallidiluteum TaxID=2812559 RepID=UPI001A962018|nr:hypothetical protein [Arenibaculum pallidiluteum]
MRIEPYGPVHYGPCPVDDPAGRMLPGLVVTMGGTAYRVAAYDHPATHAGPPGSGPDTDRRQEGRSADADGPRRGEMVGLVLRPLDACGCGHCDG